MKNKEKVILIANEASTSLAQKVAQHLCLPFTDMLRKRFADGESYHAFPGSIAGKDLVILGTTHNDESHQELLDLIGVDQRYYSLSRLFDNGTDQTKYL